MGRHKTRHGKPKHGIQLGMTNNPVGYCRLHRLVLSKHQMQVKQCKERNCRHLYPYHDPYDRAIKRAEQWEREQKEWLEQQNALKNTAQSDGEI